MKKEPRWFKLLRPQERENLKETFIGVLGVKGYERYYGFRKKAYKKPTAKLLLAYNLMRLRCKKRLSLISLEKKAGLGHATLLRLESAKHSARIDVVEKLAKALGVEFQSLFERVHIDELMKALGY